MIPSIQEVCFDYMQNLSHFIQCPSTSSGAETDPGWVSRNYYVYQMLQMTNRIIKQKRKLGALIISKCQVKTVYNYLESESQ